jgi:hypothetical protein
MELTPASYRCAEHDHDLTRSVEEQLEERVPVAYARDTARPRPFEVIVTCPGEATSHRLRFRGTYVDR